MSIVTLSFVMTGWLGKLSTCSRRSMRDVEPAVMRFDAADVGLEVADVDRARPLDERNQDVEPRARDAMEAPEPLDDHDLGLADDLDRAGGHQEHDEGDHQKRNQCEHVGLREGVCEGKDNTAGVGCWVLGARRSGGNC